MTDPTLDVRAVPLPAPWANGLKLLFGRFLDATEPGAAEKLVKALFGRTAPNFGQVQNLTLEDVRIACGQAGLGADDLPVARLRELAELLPAVTPQTPTCEKCGQFPLTNNGGKIVTLRPGSRCPFCDGSVLLPTMRLRKVAWTDGRLVEPSVTSDLRAVPGISLPLDDESIVEWAGEDVSSRLLGLLRHCGVPLYGWLAYVNLRERALPSVTDAAELLCNPAAFGYDRTDDLRRSIVGAADFLAAREILNVSRDRRFPFIEDGADDLQRMTVGDRTYVIEGLVEQGDRCDVYRGAWDDLHTERVIIKACRGGRDDAKHLMREVANLAKLQNSNADGTAFFSQLLPIVAQFGSTRDADGAERSVAVFQYKNRFDWTLADVIREYPEGVDPKTMVWMCNRVSVLLKWCRQAGVIHGGIVPEHVLIQPEYHAATLVSWGNAAFTGGVRKPVVKPLGDRYVGYCTEEVRDGAPASFATDIAMLSRTMIAVLGGNPGDGGMPRSVPEPIGAFLVTHARYGDGPLAQRFDDATAFSEAFGKVVGGIYGPRKFHPFRMPRPSR